MPCPLGQKIKKLKETQYIASLFFYNKTFGTLENNSYLCIVNPRQGIMSIFFEGGFTDILHI